MASIGVDERDEFLSNLNSVRNDVKTKFSHAHLLLHEREAILLRQLEELEDSYKQQYLRENKQMKELLATKEQLQFALKGNENKITLSAMLAPLEAKLRELEEGGDELQRIELNWSRVEELENLLTAIGTIKLTKEIDYTRRKIPVLSACIYKENTTRLGQFAYPGVIAIHPVTNNLFISDGSNNRVQVFDKFCEFLFSFSKRMNFPSGISFHDNQVYVTQYLANSVNIYLTNGEYVQSLGSSGDKELEFKYPLRICISEYANNIYISDYGNSRVQVLNTDLTFNSFILGGKKPKDVQVTENEIFILDGSDPCLHVYNYEHQLIRELISFGKGGSDIMNSLFFCIDRYSNILLTDCFTCSVLIFSKEGKLIHKFGKSGNNAGEFIDPHGIAIDSNGKIVVVSTNPKHCIQFF
ncbi:PEP-CTERM domain protein [Oopsacas minuta]|uniref:PEP-CTERM domain protein n=1 Tax=Oopsacas minuta TaxID=111878 RepID=A0AAV7K7F1_9METZ|nr:PEP-CTERM domain protein [Oopsacas minuta]